MTRRASLGFGAFLVLAAAGTAQAQSAPTAAATPDNPRFLLGVSGQYGAPQRWGAGVDSFLPIAAWHCEDGLCGGRALEAQLRAGAGAWGIAGGPALMAYPLWFD